MELIPGLPDDIAFQCLIRVPYQDFTSISSVCRRWEALLHLPHFYKQRKLSGFSQRVIAMPQDRFDRYQDLDNKYWDKSNIHLTLFEPQAVNWTKLPELPSMHDCSYRLPEFCKLASVGYDVVVLSGFSPGGEASPLVLIYNFVSGTWRRGSNMPGGPRYSFAYASDNKRTVFVAGGHYDISALSYDVVNDEWTPLPDMAHAVNECKGFFRQGSFHVICGCHTQEQVFDVEKWAWDEVEEDFEEVRTCLSKCVIDGNGKIYKYYEGKVFMLGEREGKFKMIAAVPKELSIMRYMIEWDGNLLVIVAQKVGVPSEAYLLDLKSGLWTKVMKPTEFSGFIHSHCCLEI